MGMMGNSEHQINWIRWSISANSSIKTANLHLETRKVAGAVCYFCLFCFPLRDMAYIVLSSITKPYPRQTGNTASRYIIIFGNQLCLWCLAAAATRRGAFTLSETKTIEKYIERNCQWSLWARISASNKIQWVTLKQSMLQLGCGLNCRRRNAWREGWHSGLPFPYSPDGRLNTTETA